MTTNTTLTPSTKRSSARPWVLILGSCLLIGWCISSWWGWPQHVIEHWIYRPLTGQGYSSGQAEWWSRLDGWIHLVTVAALSVVAIAWCQRYGWRRRWAFIAVSIIALTDESLQALAPKRTSSLIDLSYGALGLALVLLLSSWWLSRRTPLAPAHQPPTQHHHNKHQH